MKKNSVYIFADDFDVEFMRHNDTNYSCRRRKNGGYGKLIRCKNVYFI